jgi:hypothetical protein
MDGVRALSARSLSLSQGMKVVYEQASSLTVYFLYTRLIFHKTPFRVSISSYASPFRFFLG